MYSIVLVVLNILIIVMIMICISIVHVVLNILIIVMIWYVFNSTCCTEYTYNSDDNVMYSIVHVVLNILIIVMIMICIQ